MGNNRPLYLNEISLKKELNKIDSDLDQLLRRNGWTLLGHGAEATVAYHGQKRYVLKLFPTNSRYKHFVSFCLRNRQNPHWPKFGKDSRQIPGTAWSYVRMDLLQKVSQDTLLQQYLSDLCYLKYAAHAHNIEWINSLERRLVRQIMDSIKNNPSWLRRVGMKMNLAGQPEVTSSKVDALVKTIAAGATPSWRQACDSMLLFMNKVDYKVLDLHEANFMLRGNQLVIADPWI